MNCVRLEEYVCAEDEKNRKTSLPGICVHDMRINDAGANS